MKNLTNWGKLCTPGICGLLATNPSLYSVTLHNTGFKILDLPFTYHAFKVNDLNIAVQAMTEMGFRGYSVTIPFKEDALKFVDVVSDASNAIGALNTIINDGKILHGINTDWIGIRQSLLELQKSYEGNSALIIGAGGAAKAAIYTLQKMKFGQITILNRTNKKAKEVAMDFDIDHIESAKLNVKNLASFDLIINATPSTNIEFFPYQGITEDQIIFEMITSETKLTISGRKIGAKVATGIRMLLHQGLEQFRLFTEKTPPREPIEEALLDLYKKNNPF